MAELSRVLVVHPGVAFAVSDVYDGLIAGLVREGITPIPYGLAGRVNSAQRWLWYLWRDARKAGADLPRPTWAEVIYHASVGLLERALRHEVHAVIVICGKFLHPDAMVLCRRARVPVALVLTESPYELEGERKAAAVADLVWTIDRAAVAPLAAVAGGPVRYLACAWHPDRHVPAAAAADVPAHDVVFIGTGWRERWPVFEALAARGIDLGLYGHWPEDVPAALRPYVKPGTVAPDRVVALYRAARVAINVFRPAPVVGPVPVSLNPRCFEVAATGGAVLVSEDRPELAAVFGGTVPAGATPAALVEAVAGVLALEAPARAALAGRIRAAAAGHSWADRARQVGADLREVLAGRGAVVTV